MLQAHRQCHHLPHHRWPLRRRIRQLGVSAADADPVTKKIDMPMLMIDDEADNASVNASRDRKKATSINQKIRDLLSLFRRNAYVGYTATPYANILIMFLLGTKLHFLLKSYSTANYIIKIV